MDAQLYRCRLAGSSAFDRIALRQRCTFRLSLVASTSTNTGTAIASVLRRRCPSLSIANYTQIRMEQGAVLPNACPCRPFDGACSLPNAYQALPQWSHRLNYELFLLPVTSSHLSPSSFLISSTFFQASSFISTKAARPLAYSVSGRSNVVMNGHPPGLNWAAA